MTAMMIEAALRALVFAIAVGASLRLLRVSNVPVRKAAWSVVLVASLAMPFLMRWPAAAGWAGRVGMGGADSRQATRCQTGARKNSAGGRD